MSELSKAGMQLFSLLVQDFNPYHDARGRFTNGSGATSFTIRTKNPTKQGAAEKAKEKEKKYALSSKLDEIGGQGAKSVKAAISSGKAKFKQENQEKLARFINNSDIQDFTSSFNDDRYHFKLTPKDGSGRSVLSQPKKDWYDYDTAILSAAWGLMSRE